MSTNKYGQLITFAIEIDSDESFSQFIHITTSKGDTSRRIAARHGHPEEALTIAALNGMRSITTPFKTGRRIRIPGNLRQGASFSVLPQDSQRPLVQDGYALYQVQSRPGDVGITQFVGYNPIQLQVPVHFLIAPGHDSAAVESDIDLLERMAGRGDYKGAAAGAPAVVRVSVTDAHGAVVPLISTSYQWSKQNPSAPLWRIGSTTGGSGGGIAWDSNARSDNHGRRIDATCTIYLAQYTPINVAERSASRRSRQRNTNTRGGVSAASGMAT